MHTDARHLPEGHVIETSLCIVGAGAAGIPLAVEVASRGRDVVLLEGGGFDLEHAQQDRYRGETVGRTYYPLEAARLHYFGGTTGHWGGFCAPLDPHDFVERSWVPGSGWPITPQALAPFHDRAGEYVELEPGGWSPSEWASGGPHRTLLPLEGGALTHKLWRFSPPTRLGSRWRTPLTRSRRIHLLTHATVCAIETTPDARTVTGVLVRQPDGRTCRVRARQVVLACSTLQNVRLLLASNDRQPAGLGNAHDQVGRGFMEHLEMPVGTAVLLRPGPMHAYAYDWGVTRARVELALTPEEQESRGTLNASFALEHAAPQEAGVSTFDREPPEVLESYRQDTRDGLTPALRDAARAEARSHDAATMRSHPWFTVMTRQEQSPNDASRITLSRERDAWGVPRARLDWQLTALDLHSMRAGALAVAGALGRAGIGRMRLPEWLAREDGDWPARVSGGWHDLGGTRMHTDPRRGVVDPNCRVHGVANLYLAGGGVFPTAGSANPTLTIIALALRLAAHLCEGREGQGA